VSITNAGLFTSTHLSEQLLWSRRVSVYRKDYSRTRRRMSTKLGRHEQLCMTLKKWLNSVFIRFQMWIQDSGGALLMKLVRQNKLSRRRRRRGECRMHENGGATGADVGSGRDIPSTGKRRKLP